MIIRRAWPKLLLVTIGGFAGLAVGITAEASFRLSGLRALVVSDEGASHQQFVDASPLRFDSELGWSPIPGFRDVIPGWGLVTTDGLGFRSPELDLKRDKVVILGDSVAWGWGVADRDSLSSRLQETLASASYQVVNMAVPGYGTDQELVWLDRNIARVKARHGIRLVILVICSHNDLRNIAVPWSEGRAKPSVRLVAGKVVMRGPVMKYGLTNLLSASFLPLAWTQHLLSALMKRTPSDEAKSLMARLLDQMQLLVESRGGAKFAVVLSPSIVAFRSKNARRQEEYAWFRQMLSNRRFPVLDFKKTLDRQRAPERLFLEDGVHFTPAGNELLARAVYTNLIKPIIRDGDRPLASRSSR